MSNYAQIDGNAGTVQVAYGGGKLYQRHDNGQVWRFNGPHASPRWSRLGGNDSLLGIAASNKHFYKLRTNGQLLRYNESSQGFDVIKQINNVQSVITSEKAFYYVLNRAGIATEDIDDPSASYEELEKLYEQSKAAVAQRDAEINRLHGVKDADDKIIKQLQSDYEGAQAQTSTLTAELNASRDEAARTEKALQDRIADLQKALVTAEVAEKKLADDLDAEKKKEHEEWKKAQEHDAEDHKALASVQQALEQSQVQNADLKKQVDELTKEVTADKGEIKNLEEALAEAKNKQELAEAELKKHFTDDISDDLVISGLETVIQGLKKEIEGQEILIAVLKKQLAK